MLPQPTPSHSQLEQPAAHWQSKDRNWSDGELSRLSAFMVHHGEKFQGERTRKEAKVFAVLSRYVKTRNANQCRNYFHKLMAKFADYQLLLDFLAQSRPNFQEDYHRQLPLLQAVVFPSRSHKGSKDGGQQRISSPQPDHAQEHVKEESGCDRVDLKPTDVSYCEDHHDIPKQPLYEQPSESKIRQRRVLSPPSSSVLDESFFASHPPAAAQHQKRWKDCHSLFVQWSSKAMDLLDRRHLRHSLFL